MGRLGTWFGSERVDARPDLITTAKGITSGYFAMGAVVMHDRVAAPVLRDGAMFNHGLTYSGHPVGAAVALKNIEIIERAGLLENVRSNEPWLQQQLNALRTLPIVGDVRGMGYFWAMAPPTSRLLLLAAPGSSTKGSFRLSFRRSGSHPCSRPHPRKSKRS